MNRRAFCRNMTVAAGATAAFSLGVGCQQQQSTALPAVIKASATPPDIPTVTPQELATATFTPDTARIALIKTTDRAAGVRAAIELLGVNPAASKKVLLKPNFNSADPAPGSTHNDVLRALAAEIHNMAATDITVADRSGMGATQTVLAQKGIPALADEVGFDLIDLDNLEKEDWVLIEATDYWSQGFAVPRMLLNSECIIQTCNLKTHQYGGHFTLSLKNTVGLVAKRVPGQGYNYMSELHSSSSQRLMIADANAAYDPALIVMDGVEAFVDGGPDVGTLAQTGVVIAGTDRVAVDVVGVALLRMHGTTSQVAAGAIFDQEQIGRAVELGLGVASPDKIEFVTADSESEALTDRFAFNY